MSFDFDKFEKRLLEALKTNEEFIQILVEEESAADQAKKMGLTTMGFGRWGKDGKVTHKTTKDGKLEPVKQDTQEPKPQQQTTPPGSTTPKSTTIAQPQSTTPTTTPKPAAAPKPAATAAQPVAPAPTKQPTQEPEKKHPNVPTGIVDKVKKWAAKTKREAREFFKEELHHGKTPQRRSLVQSAKDKVKGAIKAIKHGAKHELAEFRDAGRGVRSIFRGHKPNKREQHAMKAVGIKIVTTALFGAAGGGLAHGLSAFGMHVMQEFIPHVVAETVLKGAGKAALFAGAENNTDDAMMEKFADLIMKNFEEMDIPKEVLQKAIMSYKGDE